MINKSKTIISNTNNLKSTKKKISKPLLILEKTNLKKTLFNLAKVKDYLLKQKKKSSDYMLKDGQFVIYPQDSESYPKE